MAKFRIKVNVAHPIGSINMRDSDNKTITVNARDWTPVDSISPGMEVWRKYLIIEDFPMSSKRNVSEDSTDAKTEKVFVVGKPKAKGKGK